MNGRLSQLWVYPVKSLAGVRLDGVGVDDRGLEHDRRFMIVDGRGRFLSQRERPALARLSARIDEGALQLVDEEDVRLEVPLEGGQPCEVTVWGDTVAGLDQGDAPAAWLTERIGAPARLARMPKSTRRPADPRYARPSDLVGFADGFPFLLVGQSSLDELNRRLPEPVDMRRFRPNLVVEGTAAFAEDEWSEIEVGALTFHMKSRCSRCSIVDVDPERGESDKAVLPELARFRRDEGKVWFGVNLVHDGPGALAVGDAVVVR